MTSSLFHRIGTPLGGRRRARWYNVLREGTVPEREDQPRTRPAEDTGTEKLLNSREGRRKWRPSRSVAGGTVFEATFNNIDDILHKDADEGSRK
jgi:hypothetical protein